MRAHRQSEDRDAMARPLGLMKIGEQLRAEYGAVEPPMPEHLATLLKELVEQEAPTCPQCKRRTMVQVVHVHKFGGHPALATYQCPRCRYIAGSLSEAVAPFNSTDRHLSTS